MSKQAFLAARANTDTQLYIASIFETVDGETNAFHTGTWSVFIRLQGCRIGCVWCDTRYTWSPTKGGELMSPAAIIERLATTTTARKVTVTGGEPMEQWGYALGELFGRLRLAGYQISMETGGCDDLMAVTRDHPYVNLIVDYKPRSAQIVRPQRMENFALLSPADVVKIVVGLPEVRDIPAVVHALRTQWGCRARLVFSPLWQDSGDLAAFIAVAREVGLPALGVGLNLQTHKVIWPDNVRDEEANAAKV